MLMAGRAPQVWAGVSAWCGIFDLREWHQRHAGDNYGRDMELACGGAPGSSDAIDAEYRNRSASNWLAGAKAVPLDLNAGIFDGHKGSVPVSHSLNAFNAVSSPKDKVTDADIAWMTEKAEVPEALQFKENDALYQKSRVLFRKISGNSRVSLFQGGHEIVPVAGLAWLEQQQKGVSASWSVPTPSPELMRKSVESGK